MSEFEPTEYVCTECGEEDRDRAIYAKSPDALICWACGAGGAAGGGPRSVGEQLIRQMGMLPKKKRSEA